MWVVDLNERVGNNMIMFFHFDTFLDQNTTMNLWSVMVLIFFANF